MDRFCDCQHPDCRVCNVCNAYEQENAKLRQQLESYKSQDTSNSVSYTALMMAFTNAATRAEAAEAKLKALDEQEPVAEVAPSNDGSGVISVIWGGRVGKLMFGDKLYAKPIPPADVQAAIAQAREEGRKEAMPDVDWLSNVIRTADGSHTLGAGALAESIVEAMLSAAPSPASLNAKEGGE